MQLIIDEGYADKVDLHFNTNGMLMPQAIINMVLQFRKVEMVFSVDDIGPRLNYHRHGADWELIKKNIAKVPQDKNITISIYATVNNYNVWYIDEAMPEFKKLTPRSSYDFVYEPDFLSPRKLNKLIKSELEDKYGGDPEHEKLLKYIRSDKEDLTTQFHKHIKLIFVL